MKPATLLIAASLLLTGCSNLTTFAPLHVEPPASSMVKFEGPAALPASADLGTIMEADGDLATRYGHCAAAHNALVDYLLATDPGRKTDRGVAVAR